MYAWARTFCGQLWRLRLRNPRDLVALVVVCRMCSRQERSLLMWIPRYLPPSTTSRVWPWRWYLVSNGLFLRVIRMVVHFSGWKDICQSDSHFSSAVRSSCSLFESCKLSIGRNSTQSSANIRSNSSIQNLTKKNPDNICTDGPTKLIPI